MRETKTLPLAELKIAGADGQGGSFEGYASVFGTVDSYGDTVDPGAYAETIPQFLQRGFIGWSHDWTEPIGIVTQAREDAKGLLIGADFHTDAEAQKFRLRAAERVAAGKFMGLSIGYEPLTWEMRQVPTPYRNQWGEFSDKVRALTKIKLFEVSLVTVPAEENSGVTTIKNQNLSLPDELTRTLAVVSQATGRVESLADLRASEGRKRGQRISRATRTELEAIAEALAPFVGASERIRALLASEDEADQPDKGLDALYLDFQATLAQLNGVPVRS